MTIPAVIAAYFAADHQGDPEVLIPLFTPDAMVSDERTRHQGIRAIIAWWTAAKEKYGHTSEPLDVSEIDTVHVVRARVTGRFPGSPLTLTYRFRLEAGAIAGLEIG